MPTSKILTVTAFLVALILGALLIFSLSSTALDSQSRSTLIALGKTGQIQRQMEVLSTTASTYLEVAPREYDHFFRDVEVLHPTLLALLDSLQSSFDALDDLSLDRDLNYRALAEEWRVFRVGLDEQLGVDPDFPRLEWGARHISEQLPSLTTSLNDLHAALEARQP
ncbi:MAG: hypothetical protein V2J10_01510 [Wenzhouxiangella sp.]|jgi:hypothetical protein|nr:hypothetical protein [Wenzhouxiangella sp.]